MPDCFWTGFVNSYASECGGPPAPPDGCEGVPPPPSSVNLSGTTGCIEGGVSWALSTATPGYVGVDGEGIGCRAGLVPPTTVTLIRECDAATFVVPVGDADIVCC